jgi:hypothetical protein
MRRAMNMQVVSPSGRAWFLGLLALAIVAAGGCGRGRKLSADEMAIVGRVTKGGEPLPLDPNLSQSGAAYVQVSFFRLLDGGEFGRAQSVIAAADGKFKTIVPAPGRYRVAVEHFNGGPEDLLRGRFASQGSPIEIDIAANPPGVKTPPEIAIELDEYAKQRPRK